MLTESLRRELEDGRAEPLPRSRRGPGRRVLHLLRAYRHRSTGVMWYGSSLCRHRIPRPPAGVLRKLSREMNE